MRRDIRDGVHCDLRDGEGASAVLDGALHPGPEVAGLGGRLQVASTRPGRHILLPSWLPTQVTNIHRVSNPDLVRLDPHLFELPDPDPDPGV